MKGYWNSPIVRRLLSKKVLTGFFCLLVGVGVLWWLLVPKEPSYQGKTLTEWQDEIAYQTRSKRGQEFNVILAGYRPTLQKMEPHVIPMLLQQLQAKDSPFEVWLRGKCYQRGWDTPFFSWQKIEHDRALLCFGVLQDSAHPAIPELMRLVKGTDELVSRNAMTALSIMEVDSPEYLNFLLELIRNSSEFRRNQAMHCLWRMGDKARKTIPELEKIKKEAESKQNGSAQAIETLIQAIKS